MKKNKFVSNLVDMFILFIMGQIHCGKSAITFDDSVLILKSPDGLIKNSIEGVEGETFTATCLANRHSMDQPPASLEWISDKELMSGSRISQKWDGNYSVVLTITKLNRSDAGVYKCLMVMADSEAKEKRLVILVKPEGEKTEVCGVTRFRCVASNDCIFNRYMCDGVPDCPIDGSDESVELCSADACKGKFHCNNSRCIDQRLVCDRADSCGDNSDEVYGCPTFSAHTTPRSYSAEDEHFNWLKTTVYTVIGCTVATVIFISFIVIIVFRLKMKRLRARRLAHQMQRQRAHNMDGASDQDPFLAFTTQSHYGNIIVNVNNGVQCVGGSDIATGFQKDNPPPYSEVVNKGSDFPPPPYSTIDRANQRRQNAGGSGRLGGAGPSSGGLFPVNGSGIAVVGPPLSHPARQQYLQRNSTGSQDGACNGSGSTSANTEPSATSQRNSAASDGAASTEAQQPAVSTLPPPPPPPPLPPPPPSSPSTTTAQPAGAESQEGQAPLPPPRSTSIVDSQAGPPPPTCSLADHPPPLPPRNDTQPTSQAPLAAAAASSSVAALPSGLAMGNLVVQEGKIVLASPSPVPSPTTVPSATSTCSSDKDFPTPQPGKLEVRQGQIILNMSSSGAMGDGERACPHTSQSSAGGGCELQVRDGKIIFKR